MGLTPIENSGKTTPLLTDSYISQFIMCSRGKSRHCGEGVSILLATKHVRMKLLHILTVTNMTNATCHVQLTTCIRAKYLNLFSPYQNNYYSFIKKIVSENNELPLFSNRTLNGSTSSCLAHSTTPILAFFSSSNALQTEYRIDRRKVFNDP